MVSHCLGVDSFNFPPLKCVDGKNLQDRWRKRNHTRLPFQWRINQSWRSKKDKNWRWKLILIKELFGCLLSCSPVKLCKILQLSLPFYSEFTQQIVVLCTFREDTDFWRGTSRGVMFPGSEGFLERVLWGVRGVHGYTVLFDGNILPTMSPRKS